MNYIEFKDKLFLLQDEMVTINDLLRMLVRDSIEVQPRLSNHVMTALAAFQTMSKHIESAIKDVDKWQSPKENNV